MSRSVVSSCSRLRPIGDPRVHGGPEAYRRADPTGLVDTPFRFRAGRESLLIRPACVADLPAVAAMHRRCSPQSLLDRYRLGGRPPAVTWVDQMLRLPLSYVAIGSTGGVVALAVAARDPLHSPLSAEIGVVVEDSRHGLGLGSELVSHLGGVALVTGYAELIAYPGTTVSRSERLLANIGRTRLVVEDGDLHLHTSLPEGAGLGIGAVREKLAG
jgi:hypothetical protein